MPPIARYRPTFYFLEGIAAILLSESLITTLDPLAIAGLVLILSGLVWHRARQASWGFLVFLGLVGLVTNPAQDDAYVMGLAGIYIVFNSGLLGTKPLFYGLAAIVLTVLCQVLGLVLHPYSLWINLLHQGAADVILVVLTVVFRRQLMGIEPMAPHPRPVLRLSDYDLSDRETQILHFVWAGLAAKEIATELNLSYGHVRNMLTQIYQKLGLTEAQDLRAFIHTHRIVVEEQGGQDQPLFKVSR